MSVILNGTWATAWRMIEEQLRLSDTRKYPTDILRQTALVNEESGEAMKAALDVTRPTRSLTEDRQGYAELSIELAQTAAMAVRQLVYLKEEGFIDA